MTPTPRVPIKPEILRWARERAGLDMQTLMRKFPRWKEWEGGTLQPTLRQLELIAKEVHLPIGHFFAETPPKEKLPIPDLRPGPNHSLKPSPELLDTIYIVQQRLTWYREFLEQQAENPLPFVGKSSLQESPEDVAGEIRRVLGLDELRREAIPTWSEAFRALVSKVESRGILVMVSSVVGNNPHRPLDPREFRGFAIADSYAPVIFVNAADFKAAQIFTLAHELAHIWLGKSGVSNPGLTVFFSDRVEQWCNRVAAELLVPKEELLTLYRPDNNLHRELQKLARHFKVSTLVVLRRLLELRKIKQSTFRAIFEEEVAEVRRVERRTSAGGNFYRTLALRASKTFSQALLVSTLEGRTLYREALHLLAIRSVTTLKKFARELGVI